MIKFTCPSCKRVLSADEKMAGKKAKCPHCQNVGAIPRLPGSPAGPPPASGVSAPPKSVAVASAKAPATAPATAPASSPPSAPEATDVEALAADTFIDKPEEAPPEPEPTTIEFPCPYCDEPMSVTADLAGKQAPCKECGRIVKVPLLKKKEAKDWRKVDRSLPTLAKRDNEPAPEGAWGSTTSTAAVSRAALEEAAAIPIVKEPLRARQWVNRILVGTLAVAALFTIGWYSIRKNREIKQQNALELARNYLPPDGPNKPNLQGAAAAAIFRGLGEYAIRAGKAEDARQRFRDALGHISIEGGAGGSLERDASLIDLALAQVDLGGSGEEVTKKVRLPWTSPATLKVAQTDHNVLNELKGTLNSIKALESRLQALREVGRKLIAKDQIAIAQTFAQNIGPVTKPPEEASECVAVVAWEMMLAGRKEAESLASAGLVPYQPAAGKGRDDKARRPPLAPTLLALLVAMDHKGAKELTAPPTDLKQTPPLEARIGYAQAWAYQGNVEKARDLAKAPGSTAAQVQALVAAAGAAVDKNVPDAGKLVEDAANLVGSSGSRGTPPWVLMRLVRLGVAVGQADKMRPVVDSLADSELHGRALLEMLRPQLEDPAQAKKLLDQDKLRELTYPLIREELARQLAKSGNSSAVLDSLKTWDPEHLRPFGYIGVALGTQ